MFDLGSFGRDVRQDTTSELLDSTAAAIPHAVRVVIVLALSYVGIRFVLAVLRRVLGRVYPERQALVADLFLTVVRLLLWFGVALAVLSMLGLGAIAASLGTATGFVALGVAYALSEMIEDTVAGVYLLRDPDFELGDRVETEAATGRVRAIELRKCRIETEDGDVVVQANRSVESGWTKHAPEP